MELNRFYNLDCLIGMPEKVPDEAISLILADLPYGNTQNKWDVILPFDRLWSEYERIIKPNGAIVLTAAEPFSSLLVTSNLQLYKDKWVWVKNKATGHLNSKKMPLNTHEDVLVFYKNPPVYNPQMTAGHKPMNYAVTNHSSSVYGAGKPTRNNAGTTLRYPKDVLYFDVVNNDDPERIHDNQKPVPLFEYFIKTYTNPGDIVLDNCAGSGTTAIAADISGRNWICFENHEEIFMKGQNRVFKHLLGDLY